MANNYQPFNRSLLAMAALQALPLSLFAQNTGEKPNILYIMCDDHAIQAISAVVLSILVLFVFIFHKHFRQFPAQGSESAYG